MPRPVGSSRRCARSAPTRVIDWIVVGFHHCAYCTNAVHGSDGGVREGLGEAVRPVRGRPRRQRPQPLLRASAPHSRRGGRVRGPLRRHLGQSSGARPTSPPAAAGRRPTRPSSPERRTSRRPRSASGCPSLAPWSAFTDPGNSVVAVDVRPPGADGVTRLLVRVVSVDRAGPRAVHPRAPAPRLPRRSAHRPSGRAGARP